jgi:hypothetical protein
MVTSDVPPCDRLHLASFQQFDASANAWQQKLALFATTLCVVFDSPQHGCSGLSIGIHAVIVTRTVTLDGHMLFLDLYVFASP